MAMTKAEKDRMANLERGIKLARAMHWPRYSIPEPMTRDVILDARVPVGVRNIRMACPGYFANPYTRKVTKGCSDGYNHNFDGDQPTTQGMGEMYRTEREAFIVLRMALTEMYATALASVDERLAAVGD